MIVTYASAPATLSCRPLAATGAGAAAAPPPADCPTGFPHAAQLFAPAVSCAPQFGQKAIIPPGCWCRPICPPVANVASNRVHLLGRGHYHQTPAERKRWKSPPAARLQRFASCPCQSSLRVTKACGAPACGGTL